MLTKEYRIAMPLTVKEYHIGQVSLIKNFMIFIFDSCMFLFQLYMIARHSNEQSQGGDGVEAVINRECTENEEK